MNEPLDIAALKAGFSGQLKDRAAALGIAPSADPRLLEHTKVFLRPALEPMGEGIHAGIGFDYTVMAFIQAPDGIVMYDCDFFLPKAQIVWDRYRREVVDRPVAGIIYSHTHADHVGGTKVYTDAAVSDDIPVWGPEGWEENFHYETASADKVYRRGMSQFGMMLPVGLEGTVSGGLGGPVEYAHSSPMAPITNTIGRELTEFEVAGRTFVGVVASGDRPQNLMVSVPETKTLFAGDVLDSTFVPMATARWEPSRVPRQYAESMATIMREFPDTEFLVSGHGRVVRGVKNIQGRVRHAYDLVQFTCDFVERGVAKGWSPDKIIDAYAPPEHVADDPYLQTFYHRRDWILRGM